MADEFSFTDSDDERAVEDVLSQALDHSVLEQIAAINCSSFSSKDNLPFDLENRFRKLKSLPAASTATSAASARFPPSKSESFTPRPGADSVDFERISDLKNCSDKPSPFTGDPKQHSEEYSDEKKASNSRSKLKSSKDFRKTKSLKSKAKTDSSESSPSSDDSEHSDGNLDEKIGTDLRSKPKSSSNSKTFRQTKSLKSKSRNDSSESSLEHSDGSLNEKIGTDSRSKLKSSSNSRKTNSSKSKSRTDSWSVSSPESESRSVSPVRRGIGCLWCSPKKEKRKQGKENLNRLSPFSSSLGHEYEYEYEYDSEFLKTFSTKEQRKIMRKAMKEEEKINREAEKIVKWAKQASSQMMDVSGVVDHELSDLEK